MLISCPVMKRWFSNNLSWVCRELCCFRSGLLLRLVKKFAVAILTCVLALGGAAIGAITGAIKGHTTETGLSHGFVIGAVAGAITGVQLMDLIANGEPFSKVALISSLVSGKIYMEWVSPAVLKAYQWQVSMMETNLGEISDIFEVATTKGLSQDTIKELPVYKIYNSETCCPICLQDLNDGEHVRVLPSCRHVCHLHCVDEWLSRRGSCPICRGNV